LDKIIVNSSLISFFLFISVQASKLVVLKIIVQGKTSRLRRREETSLHKTIQCGHLNPLFLPKHLKHQK